MPGSASRVHEGIIASLSAPTNPYVFADTEYKTVARFRSLTGSEIVEQYTETTVGGGFGPNLIGLEYSSHTNSVAGMVGFELGGVGVHAKDGEVMAGATLPSGQGARIGVDAELPGTHHLFVTTRGYVDSVGGLSRFGSLYARGGSLKYESWWGGAYVDGAWVSGYDLLLDQLRLNGLVNYVEAVP